MQALKPYYRKRSMVARAGVMLVPWKDGATDIHADRIRNIEYSTPDDFHVKIVLDTQPEGKDLYKFNKENYPYDIKAMIRDMYRRALNGEDVDFKDYLPTGHPTLKQHPDYKAPPPPPPPRPKR